MAILRVGGPVPNRKRRRNPETVSGYPQINTFQGLGIRSVTTDLRIQASRAGVKTGGGRGKAKKLDLSNLCHRCDPRLDPIHGAIRKAHSEARRLSLLMDRLSVDSPVFDTAADTWGKHIHHLIEHRQHDKLRDLIHMEALRGQVRTKLTLARGGITL